jgi:hypothetical protein
MRRTVGDAAWLKAAGGACESTVGGTTVKSLLVGLAAISLLAGQNPPFVCADYTQGKVFLVDGAGKIEWSYDAPNANDVWALPNGNLLFNMGHGVREVTRDKRVVFSYESSSEVYACQRLPDGNTFIGECNAGRLLEVSPEGKILKQIRLLPAGADGRHRPALRIHVHHRVGDAVLQHGQHL